MAVSKKLLARLRRPAEAARGLPALAGLDDVDWAALEHAHGKATDVPVLLRAAAGDDPDARDEAFELLYETVCHQGSFYTATPAVVPFLYRLLEADEAPDKEQFALLLATLAGYQFATHPDDPTGADPHRAATRRAVGRQLDLLFPYLRHPDWEVRHAVAWAIGRYPEIAVRLRPRLEAAYGKERDKSVRLALAWAIGQSPEGAARVLPELDAALGDESNPWHRQAVQGVMEALRRRHA